MNPNGKLIVVAGGAGKLGRLLVDAVLGDPGARVRVLVRDPGKPDVSGMAGPRVELLAFDAVNASPAERAAAVKGAYAVVSALQGGPEVIIDAQLALLEAAKAAGARRFIPSDYSYNIFTLPEGININSDWRRTLAERARAQVSETFEVVHVMQGIFADPYVLGFLGVLDLERGVVRYWGDGLTPIDWTTWEDTARFTAAAALDERPVPAHLFVSGDRMDVLTFAKTWGAASGRALTLERLGSLAELEAETHRRLRAEPTNMYAWLPLMYARGVFGGQALLPEKHNHRYPHVSARTVAQAARSLNPAASEVPTNEDKLQILELLNRYILSIDSHDDAEFADNFHDDGVYVSPFGTAVGREQILATIHQWHAGGITAGKRHMIGAWRIDLNGAQATSQSSYWVVNAKEGTSIVASGGYVDELTKKNGRWKLQKRIQTIDPSFKG